MLSIFGNVNSKLKNSSGELLRSNGSFTNCDNEMINILIDSFYCRGYVGDKCSDNYSYSVAHALRTPHALLKKEQLPNI